MKAVLVTGYGDVDQLVYTDVPDPKPGADEVLVKVAGLSINPFDLKLRSGQMKESMPVPLPFILGSDAAGEVVEVGVGVTNFKKGDSARRPRSRSTEKKRKVAHSPIAAVALQAQARWRKESPTSARER